MERRWDGQRGQRTPQLIVVCLFPEQARLEHHLGQLFHKQRHAIGLGHDLLAYLSRQALPPCHPVDHLLDLRRGQTAQRERGHMRPEAPWGVKLRATGEQGQDAGRRLLVDEEGQQLQCRGINPV